MQTYERAREDPSLARSTDDRDIGPISASHIIAGHWAARLQRAVLGSIRGVYRGKSFGHLADHSV